MLGIIGLVLSGKFWIGIGIGAVAVYLFKPLIDAGIAKVIKKNT